jgi:hypothetical protein
MSTLIAVLMTYSSSVVVARLQDGQPRKWKSIYSRILYFSLGLNGLWDTPASYPEVNWLRCETEPLTSIPC